MNGCFTVGGDAALKVKAIAIASVDELPAIAKDGWMAIISDTAAGDVHVQNDTPAQAEEGDVWVTVAEDSSAPIQLKLITLYPSKVQQYIGGVWSTVRAYVRVNGAWADLELWLFKTGNPFQTTTGGWTGNNDVVVIDSGENLRTYVGTGSYNHAVISTKNKIPAGKYNKLIVTCKRSYLGTFTVGFSTNITDFYNFDISTGLGWATYYNDFVTLTLDLSTLDDSYEGYFKVHQESIVNAQNESVGYLSEVYLCN